MKRHSFLLLDTHVLLWWLADDSALSANAKRAIANEHAQVFVSAASIWEIAIKQKIGKLYIPANLLEMLEQNRFLPLAITHTHALATNALPLLHADPFDRMLIAQAKTEKLTLVTADSQFLQYDLDLLPA